MVSNITYIRLQDDFVYLAIIMDVFTRALRGWALSRSLNQTLTLMALRVALAIRVPKIHHSDQGVQYAAETYIDLLAPVRSNSAWLPSVKQKKTG